MVHIINPKILPISPLADHKPRIQPSYLGLKYIWIIWSIIGHAGDWNRPNAARLR